jgi:hypothetical protein
VIIKSPLSRANDPKAPKEPKRPKLGPKIRARIIGVFGLPLVGKDTFIRGVLDSKPKAKIAALSSGEIVEHLLTDETRKQMLTGGLYPLEEPLRAEVKRQMDACLKIGAQIIILNGFPRMADQVQWLVDNYSEFQLGFLKLMPNHTRELYLRAQKRARDEFDTDSDKLAARLSKQSSLILEVEDRIHLHMRPYTAIVNDSVKRAVDEFWLRFSL